MVVKYKLLVTWSILVF